jgi:hypothetical protein
VLAGLSAWWLLSAPGEAGNEGLNTRGSDVSGRSAPEVRQIAGDVREIRNIDTLDTPLYFGGPDEFGSIVALQDVRGFLFISDALISPHLAVMDLRTGNVEHRFGRNGEGPGEFRGPRTIRRGEGDDISVWIHDFPNRRFSRAVLEAGAIRIADEVPLIVSTSAEQPVRLPDGFVAAGLYGDEAVLMFFDAQGRPTAKAGTPPFALRDVGHSNGIRLVNRAAMVPHPDGDRFAVTFYSANRMDIYDRHGDLVRSTRGPRPVDARFHVSNDRFFWDEGNQLAYTSVTASRDYVFALFCECALGSENVPTRRLVHAWTWEGDFVGEYHLRAQGVRTIAASEDGTSLFGSVEEPFPQIALWELPAELRSQAKR